MKNHTSLIALTLLTLAFAGCSKHSPDAAAALPKITDLGVVEVSDGILTRHDLGGGRVCIITPNVQKDGSVLLSMSIEEAGKVLLSPKVLTKSDQHAQITIGDIGIGVTPHIKQ